MTFAYVHFLLVLTYKFTLSVFPLPRIYGHDALMLQRTSSEHVYYQRFWGDDTPGDLLRGKTASHAILQPRQETGATYCTVHDQAVKEDASSSITSLLHLCCCCQQPEDHTSEMTTQTVVLGGFIPNV